jgi:hypothetical protein
MQNILCDATSHGSGLRSGWAFTALATALLSFGVGAATAAFSLMNDLAPRVAPYVACETMLQLSSDPFTQQRAGIPIAAEVQESISRADNLDLPPLAPLLAVGALAMLVACARGAARMLAAPRAPAIAMGSAIGALCVSAMLIDVFGLPAMGLRAVAFAICVSMLAVRFARTTRSDLMTAAA